MLTRDRYKNYDPKGRKTDRRTQTKEKKRECEEELNWMETQAQAEEV